MKKSFLIFLIFLFYNSSFALTIEDVLNDIKSIPTVKITLTPQENKIIDEKKEVFYEQIKAVQIFVLPSDEEELRSLFSKWRESGVNTIILRCFHNTQDRYHKGIKTPIKEGVYFKTSSVKMIEDILKEVIPIAHSYNFRVFAWMTSRYANYDERKNLEPMMAYSLNQKRIVTSKGLNILSPAVQKYIIKIFEDLASYPIDGILLQDDLFLRYNEGFNDSTVSLYKKETGLDASPDLFFVKRGDKVFYTDAFWEWRRWKSKKIAEFVSQINRAVKSKNPSIKLAVNLTYEALSNPKGALAWLAHDINYLKDVADYFSLMAYHRQIMEELNMNISEAKIYLTAMVNQCISFLPETPQRFIFKIQVKDWHTSDPINDSELRYFVTANKELYKLSLAVVPYPPDLSEQLLKEIFAQKELSKSK